MPKKTQDEFNSPFPASEEFTAAWAKWKAYKLAEHKFSYKSIYSEQEAANNLYKLSKGNVQWAMDIISTAIERGWKGFFQTDKYNKATGAFTAPEVYHGGAPVPPRPPDIPQAQPITDREMALEQFKAFKAGHLKPVYIYPNLYTYFFKMGFIKPATGDNKSALIGRAKLLRTNQLSTAATTTAELKYLEQVIREFGDDKVSPVEAPYIRMWARRLAVQDFFTQLRDSGTELETLLKD